MSHGILHDVVRFRRPPAPRGRGPCLAGPTGASALRPEAARTDGSVPPAPWAIVLAGGEGVRLRPLARLLYGEERPKQYTALMGDRSLLRQTLDRVALLARPDRTVVATMARHFRWLKADLDVSGLAPRVLAQPDDRGTAAAILCAAHWIHARDERAIVTVFPSDHLIIEERMFMRQVAAAAGFVHTRDDWTVLLGVSPAEAETEYGWIEPAGRVGWTHEGPVYGVGRFIEKPPPALARALYTTGALWNTFVFAARAVTLIEVGRRCLPVLDGWLRRAAAFAGTRLEGWALEQAYRLAPKANFSRALLEAWPLPLGVARVPDVTWCDLGTVRRVVKALAGLGIRPPWAGAVGAGA
jgi:mannose-1-phosphate guanylyltransferase